MRQSIAVARARACMGARFRPQGRSAAEGLDCAGLVAIAYALPSPPRDYPLRGEHGGRIGENLAAAGLATIAPEAAGAGDLLLLRTGPGQVHLAILTDGGFIHADAALRRVVEAPGAPPWPVIAAWRDMRED